MYSLYKGIFNRNLSNRVFILKFLTVNLTLILSAFAPFYGICLAAELPTHNVEPKNKLISDGDYIKEPVFGGELYYYEIGPKQGKPVVLVHGLGMEGISYWRYVVDEMSKTYRVIMLDLPGFGRSGKENALYSPEQYAKLLDWFIRKRTTKPVTVVGHSMGGAIALYYAATYPKNLEHLIIINAAGVLHRTAFTKHFVEIYGLDNPLLDSLTRNPISQVNELMSIILTRAEPLNKPFEIMLDYPQMSKYLLKGSSPMVTAAFALAQTDFSEVINKITTPTTIIWGREDRISPPRVAHVLNKRIPGSQLILIDEAGHNPMGENIDAMNAVLKEVLPAPVRQASSRSYKSMSFPKRDRIGRCLNQDGMRFSGYYSELRIVECSRVKLNNITTPSLFISGSKVNIFGGHFTNENTAITVRHSLLKMTNGIVKGDIAIKASGSKLDFAGVDITAIRAGIKTDNTTTLICSLCEFDVPTIQGSVHGLFTLKPNFHL